MLKQCSARAVPSRRHWAVCSRSLRRTLACLEQAEVESVEVVLWKSVRVCSQTRTLVSVSLCPFPAEEDAGVSYEPGGSNLHPVISHPERRPVLSGPVGLSDLTSVSLTRPSSPAPLRLWVCVSPPSPVCSPPTSEEPCSLC